MMQENKPMKMQWLNIDGRQVPSILPNHWNEQKNDWDITGTKNPLPVANYTQNASGVWLPTSKSNPVPTQLTGSKVEKKIIFDEVQVTPGSQISAFFINKLSINYSVAFRLRETGNIRINLREDSNGVAVGEFFTLINITADRHSIKVPSDLLSTDQVSITLNNLGTSDFTVRMLALIFEL